MTALIAGITGLLFLFNCYNPLETRHQVEHHKISISGKAEIPLLANNRKEQIINHDGFTLSYNADFRIANWVAYELTAEEVSRKDVERAKKFIPDPKVKGSTATNEDYRQSGYDRGHLVPAADMRWSAEGMKASFYFSNICPQNRELNAGLWNELEKQCRRWATRYGRILIVTGPVIENDLQRLGPNRVGIPNTFYKVICSVSGSKPEGIGFLVENRNYGKTHFKSLAVSIDSVESVTGIHFFHSLPKEVQQELKSGYNLRYWELNK